MGLFDPPYIKVKKHLHKALHGDFEKVKQATESLLPSYLTDTEQTLVIAFVTSAWALGGHQAGDFILPDKDGRYISNMGTNCINMLKDNQHIAVSIVHNLIEGGIISDNRG